MENKGRKFAVLKGWGLNGSVVKNLPATAG